MDEINTKAILDEKIIYVLDTMRKIILALKEHKEKYKAHHTTLYWTGIKMSNNSRLYQDSDIKIVEKLCSYSGEMIVCAEGMEKIANDIYQNICQIKDEITKELYLPDRMWDLNNKLNILILLEQGYIKEQEEYEKYIQLVNAFLRKKDKTSILKKWKNRIKK